MLAAVSGMFGGSIVSLAGVSLYAFCNYLLTLRTKELAIRSSLGAGPAQIAAALLHETAKALAVGSVIGTALTFAGQRILSSVMENVNPPSAGHIIAALLIIAGITFGAVLVPTVRALRMSVVDALRVE
jgi:putative ABC transport system permease protein